MQELQKVVSTAFANIVASGAIEKAIEKKLQDTITDAIEQELRGYSVFGKLLSERIKQSLQVNFDVLGLPGYNDLILKIIRKKLEANMTTALTTGIEDQMSELLAAPPTEITLLELIEAFKQDETQYGSPMDNRFTLIVEHEHTGSGMQFTQIYLDRLSDRDKYSCAHFIHLCDGKVISLRVDKKDVEKTLFIGSVHGFSKRLFQIYAAGTKVVGLAEHEEISRYYPEHD